MKKELFDMLMTSAIAEKSKALLTLLVDANDKIEALEKFFK